MTNTPQENTANQQVSILNSQFSFSPRGTQIGVHTSFPCCLDRDLPGGSCWGRPRQEPPAALVSPREPRPSCPCSCSPCSSQRSVSWLHRQHSSSAHPPDSKTKIRLVMEHDDKPSMYVAAQSLQVNKQSVWTLLFCRHVLLTAMYVYVHKQAASNSFHFRRAGSRGKSGWPLLSPRSLSFALP